MTDWQRLTATTIREYMTGIEDSIRRQSQVLHVLNPDRIPYVAPPDTRTKAERRRDKQAACNHSFSKKKTHGRHRCVICGLTATAGFVKGYRSGYEKGYDEGGSDRAMEE